MKRIIYGTLVMFVIILASHKLQNNIPKPIQSMRTKYINVFTTSRRLALSVAYPLRQQDSISQGVALAQAPTSTPTPVPTLIPTPPPPPPEDPSSIGYQMALSVGWSGYLWDAFNAVVERESGWNPYAMNVSSGACGLGQALPCSKLPCYLSDVSCQIQWVINYISSRYGNPEVAWIHEETYHWY